MFEWREILLRLVFSLVYIYEKTRRLVAFIFYPITKWYIDKKMKSMGYEFVRGKPKNQNQIGILKNEMDVYLRVAESPSHGLLSSYADESAMCLDLVSNLSGLLRNGHGRYFKDTEDWLFRHFNLQSGSMAWKTATHYDTGAKRNSITVVN